MMIDEFFNFLFNIQLLDVMKVVFSFTIFLYVIFAFVVIRQVNLMTDTINQLELPLRILAAIHFIVAILVFLLAVLIL